MARMLGAKLGKESKTFVRGVKAVALLMGRNHAQGKYGDFYNPRRLRSNALLVVSPD